jgi:transcriptional regulator with PAS, ATPase and Fis domain
MVDFQKKSQSVDYKLDYEAIKSITDCIHEAVCIIDENGTVIVWNKSAEKLYHVSRNEIMGIKIVDFFPDAMVEKVRKTKIAVQNLEHSPKEGSHVLISSMPIYINHVFKGAISTERDYEEVEKLYLELTNAKSKLIFLQNEVKKYSGSFGNIIGKSPKLTKKIEIARQIAPSHASVMITGESGTGKEVFARGIHEVSGRKGLFISVNCSAIPSELFESELFGYCPGAFTGASKKGKIGAFELSNGGTIFLDEIGDMPFNMQAKLLRVLQEFEITRLGGENKIKLDLRVISATNQNLEKMVSEKKFREDLFYRLNVINISLPSLREHKEDIPLLINHFIKKFSSENSKTLEGISQNALDCLMAYDWPGNIRELMNAVEYAVVTCNDVLIKKKSIPDYILRKIENQENSRGFQLDLTKAVCQLERENIQRAIKLTHGNKSMMAKLLHIPRGTLYHKLEKYNISLPTSD